MRAFTRAELANNDGSNGKPAYIAYQGKVYDASASFHWQQGKHQVRHKAGWEFNNEFDQAPHGADLLQRLPIIGVLLD